MANIRITSMLEMYEMSDDDIFDCLYAGMEVLIPEVKRNLKRVIKGTSEKNMPELEKANLIENMYAYKMCYKGRIRKAKVTTKIFRYHNKPAAVLGFLGNVDRSHKSEFDDDYDPFDYSKQVRRSMIAAVLEYGKKGQPPTHFLRDALSSKEDEIQAAVTKKFQEIVERNTKGGNNNG